MVKNYGLLIVGVLIAGIGGILMYILPSGVLSNVVWLPLMVIGGWVVGKSINK